jgi:hypothetical protein
MRRNPSASHCVNKPPFDVYRPDNCVLRSGAQVLRISSMNGPSGTFCRLSSTSRPSSWRNDTLSPLTSTRSTDRSSPCNLSGCAGTPGLRSSCIRLVTSVRTGSRSKVRSTVLIQNAGAL